MRRYAAVLAAVLVSCATPAKAHVPEEAPARSGPYSVELVGEAGTVLPTFSHRGRTYVLGTKGDRYAIRVRNDTGRRAEVVVSVDGRDVLDGRPASLSKRGYVVPAHGELEIDGFRLDTSTVAAFRFSSVPRSYAARMGDARDVGVVGVAVFPERERRPVRTPRGPYSEARPEAGAGEKAEAAPAPGARGDAHARAEVERPGLGTEFGEARDSQVEEVAFVRARGTPDALLTVRYDDRQGLLALGIDLDGRRWASRDRRLREEAQPFRGSGFAEPPPGWR
jgi:hypothetical protein